MMLNRRALLASSCAVAMAGTSVRETAGDLLLGEIAEKLLGEYPENATDLGLDTGARKGLKSRLSERSEAGRAAYAASCAERLRVLNRVDRSSLSGQTAINHAAALYAHQIADEGYRSFRHGDIFPLNHDLSYASTPYVVNPGVSSFFSYVPDFLDSKHAVETAADAEAYIERMQAFARGLDGETERLKADAAAGVIPPDFTMDATLGQMNRYRAVPLESWGLVTSLDRRVKEKGVKGDWGAGALAIAKAEVAPALDRQIEGLKQARTQAVHDAGIWRRTDGEAWYAWALKVGTTTPVTPDEAHRVGLAQNAELDARMDVLLKKQGLSKGTVGERMAALGKDPKVLYPNTDEGRAALIAYLNGVVADMRPRLTRAFSHLPKADVLIRRVPPEIQDGAPNGYAGAGSIDGSRPGTYNINLKDTANWPKFSLPTLTFHEAIPGHIFQGTYQNQLPLIMSLLAFNAYSEGWALYCEQLGDELGVYDHDVWGRLGYLQSIKFRAVRLVVDTGMHSKRWSREQATQFMIEATGRPLGAVQAEIDRYCFWPGQACGYKVGHNEINRLRDKARAAMGARFDVRTFNDAVVESGNVPLVVLGEVVERYMRGG